MTDTPDPDDHQVVRELVARFATQFPETALTELAARLLRSEIWRAQWDVLLGEVVACAIYNRIPLEQAEKMIVKREE
jgi:hypothetical protein